jgi:hypothetical protein
MVVSAGADIVSRIIFRLLSLNIGLRKKKIRKVLIYRILLRGIAPDRL